MLLGTFTVTLFETSTPIRISSRVLPEQFSSGLPGQVVSIALSFHQASLHVPHERCCSVRGIRPGQLLRRGAVADLGSSSGLDTGSLYFHLNPRVGTVHDRNPFGGGIIRSFDADAYGIRPFRQRLEYGHSAAVRSSRPCDMAS